MLTVRAALPSDADGVAAIHDAIWGGPTVAGHDTVHDLRALPTLVAVDGQGAVVGALAYLVDADGLEVVSIAAQPPQGGAGTALLDAAADEARRRGLRRLWLTTTNDNLDALRFYQRRGLRVTRVDPGAVDRARGLKPTIPTTGAYGIALRDELHLELPLDQRGGRNPYVDWLRAFSLIVVVLWHWAFTILVWRPDGPHATSPLRFMQGFWLLTWLLQVMPLFFYIGGYVHLRSWERARAKGIGLGPFVLKRLRQLAVPGAALLFTWIALGAFVGAYFDLVGAGRVVKLIVSPLWFLGVYLMLIALLPVALWLHRRVGVLTLVWLAGIAMCVDVVRFHYHVEAAGWVNMIVVWALAHQAGFFYDDVVRAPRRIDVALLWAGLFGLVGLVFSGLYPGSMVGVPGERFSNMAPPTFVMVALLLFQVGVVEVLRPAMLVRLARPRWARVNEVINRFALPLFLFHTTGMAIALFTLWAIGFYRPTARVSPDLDWWLNRPLAVIAPLLFTLPVIYLFGRRWVTAPRGTPAPGPATAD
jgi:GNAT superfamily N-acetyltransferase